MSRRVNRTSKLRLFTATAVLCLMGTSAFAQHATSRDYQNIDARITAGRGVKFAPSEAQMNALEFSQRNVGSLMYRFNDTTGTTRVLYNHNGYLTEASRAKMDPMDIALSFVESNVTALGLRSGDIAEFNVTDSVYSETTGATHIYLQQVIDGIPVYNAQLHVNVNRDGRVISVNNDWMPEVRSALPKSGLTTRFITADEAVMIAAKHQNLKTRAFITEHSDGPRQTTTMILDGLPEGTTAKLAYLPVHRGLMRLVWNFELHTPDFHHVYDFTIDTETGKVWTRFDHVVNEQYHVYEAPAESPIHTSPLPPADGRTLAVDPQNSTASPQGWHSTGTSNYTITRGNNVHAYPDKSNNSSGAGSPDCGVALDCTFSMNLNNDPDTYVDAAVANLFYWNNIIHDVAWFYGFDEAGGNFQVNNFGLGGNGGDDVRAEAQDGGGTNNANFYTPSDGNRPRMQMYLWTTTTPRRDGDFDAGIVVHEYGHGISNRLVGGPSAVSCLGNSQQPGEGLSDWWALFWTHEAGDAGSDKRGIGTYALGEPTSGDGIRTQAYSTDQAINNHTYESIQGKSIPHGVGEVWAQGAWEAYWALVDIYGFDANLYDAFGGAGNQRMMLYLIEGLKNTACSPTFLDVRDGIIQAATDNYGGVDVCTLWSAFAAFGWGTDAVSGGSNSTSPTNGFQIPVACQCSPAAVANAGADQVICAGDSVTIGTAAQTGNSYSWNTGATSAQITVSPTVTTTYTITATSSCGTDTDTVTVFVDDGSGGGIDDNFEGDNSDWSTTGLWHEVTNTSCVSPSAASGSTAFYYGQDSTCNYNTGAATAGSLTSPVIPGINANSTLSFNYWRVVESYSGDYDRTDVVVIHNGGETIVWERNTSNASSAGWQSSGNISLAAYAGQSIQIRFDFNSVDSVANAFTGWLIDDVVVVAESQCGGPGNTAPSASITAPADGTSVTQGSAINFTGSASDAEDGNISGSLSWSSSLDGNLGSGASVNATLSVGSHTITASVSDSGGLSASDSISVTVQAPANNPPTVSITGPADGTTVDDGTSLNFTGTASDPEDGTLSGSISWSSDLDGNLGSGASVNATLSVGTHTITASVTDSNSASASDTISVTVNSVGGGNWTELTNNNFESGWGDWNDGGTDVRRSANDSNYAHQGTYCVRLRDNSGAASAMRSDNLNLSGYSELRVNFWYYARSMETNENFFVELYNGSSWVVIANYVVNSDFSNNTFNNPEIIVNSSSVNFASNAQLRIRCDASGNSDWIYVDEVVVSAR